MKGRQFFISNSIQNFQALTKRSPFQPDLNQKINASSKKVKRVTSCHQSTSKLDPTKFINRQAFNNKLYSEKTFNIAVEFRQQKQQQSSQYFSFDNCEAFINLNKKLQQNQSGKQFSSTMKSVSHHLKNIYKKLQSDGNDQNLKVIRKQMFLLKEGVEKVLGLFRKQVQFYQKKYLKAMFSQKSKLINKDLYQSSTLLAKSRSILSSQTMRDHNLQFTSEQTLSQQKPSTSSSNLRQSRMKNFTQTGQFPNKLKTIKDKIGLLEFENKKHILRIQSLQEQNNTLKHKISQLQNTIAQMNQKVNNVKSIQDSYNYKIKKLKQELEVAHIVKQQNLNDKMRYIFHHQ